MPKTDSDLRDDPSAQENSQVNSRTRIDRAHVVAEAEEACGESEAGETRREALARDGCGLATEQLRGQADQLAAYLRSRQRGLDQRESGLNARMAQLDASARDARMTLNQRQAGLAQRESALAEREREVETRLARLASAEAVADRQRVQLTEDRIRHEEMQEEMDAQRTTLAAVRNEQARKEDTLRHDRRQIDRHRRAAMELEKKRDSLRRRSEHVDRSRAALLKLRSELGHIHRETIEIRMATEELWIQMSGRAPSGALSRSLERIRAQLADQYRTAATELAQQKQELHSIRTELSRQHEQLLERKQELEGWAKRREEEIQRQTARLAASEEELGRRQTALDDLARQWHDEQIDYQTEIRQLRARLDESACTTITA